MDEALVRRRVVRRERQSTDKVRVVGIRIDRNALLELLQQALDFGDHLALASGDDGFGGEGWAVSWMRLEGVRSYSLSTSTSCYYTYISCPSIVWI